MPPKARDVSTPRRSAPADEKTEKSLRVRLKIEQFLDAPVARRDICGLLEMAGPSSSKLSPARTSGSGPNRPLPSSGL